MHDDLRDQFERVAPLPDIYRGWRDQLKFYRMLAEKMPDQRTVIDADGAFESGPRAILDYAISDAEAAGEAGDLDGFALHIQQAVEVLIHSEFGTVGQLVIKKHGSKGGANKRGHEGPLKQLLRTIISEAGKQDIESIVGYWKDQPEIETDADDIRLSFDEDASKPYSAYWSMQDKEKAWTERSVRDALKEVER